MLFDTGMRGVVRRSVGQRLRKPEVLILWDKRGNRLTAPRALDMNIYQDVEIDLM
jgi:hypothetical protein